jgi:hypothetical protein
LSRCRLVLSSSSHCAALLSYNCVGWLLCCLSSRRHLVFSSRRTLVLLLSSHCDALSSSHHTVWLLRCPSSRRRLVLSSSSHSQRHLRHLQRWWLLSPAAQTSNVVIGVGLAITTPLPSLSPWMLFLALQPCRRSNCSCRRCQCLFHCLPPSPTLVAVTITITLFVAIAIARAAAKLPPTSCSRAATTAADAAAAAAPPPNYVALSRCRAAATAAPLPHHRLLVGCCVVVRRPILSSHAVMQPSTLSLPAAFADKLSAKKV